MAVAPNSNMRPFACFRTPPHCHQGFGFSKTNAAAGRPSSARYYVSPFFLLVLCSCAATSTSEQVTKSTGEQPLSMFTGDSGKFSFEYIPSEGVATLAATFTAAGMEQWLSVDESKGRCGTSPPVAEGSDSWIVITYKGAGATQTDSAAFAKIKDRQNPYIEPGLWISSLLARDISGVQGIFFAIETLMGKGDGNPLPTRLSFHIKAQKLESWLDWSNDFNTLAAQQRFLSRVQSEKKKNPSGPSDLFTYGFSCDSEPNNAVWYGSPMSLKYLGHGAKVVSFFDPEDPEYALKFQKTYFGFDGMYGENDRLGLGDYPLPPPPVMVNGSGRNVVCVKELRYLSNSADARQVGQDKSFYKDLSRLGSEAKQQALRDIHQLTNAYENSNTYPQELQLALYADGRVTLTDWIRVMTRPNGVNNGEVISYFGQQGNKKAPRFNPMWVTCQAKRCLGAKRDKFEKECRIANEKISEWYCP